MPIRVQCACGAAFAAKDELAGRTVKCPKCQQPLKIPAAGAPTPAAPAARPMSAPLPSQAGSALYDSGQRPHGPHDSMFDDVGLKTQQAGTAPCPGCASPMPANAVVCIKCGFNKKIGRRMETVRNVEAAAIPGGHSVSVEELLGKAAQSIEDDKAEERKKTSEGLPWWVYLIGMFCVIGFMVTMMILPPDTALLVGGSIMWVVTLGLMFYAEVRLLMIAFSEGVSQGVMFLICGPYQLFFIFTHWDQCGGYVLMSLAANVVNTLVQGVMVYTLGQEEDARRPDPHPPAVARADFDYHPIPLRKADRAA